MGRATQGVTLINIDEGTHLAGVQRVVGTDTEEPEGNGADAEPQAPSSSEAE